MSLTEGDKAICAEMSRQIVEEVSQRLLKLHMETCPHGKLLSKTRNLMIGACIGSSIGSGSLVLLVGKIVSAL